MIYFICRLLCKALYIILFRFSVRGKEHIPKKGAFILAGNHVSYLDPPAVGIACGRYLSYMARDDLFIDPFFGWFLRSLRVFPVKRDSPDRSALIEASHHLKHGEGLVLFPEGSRNFNGRQSKAYPGVAFLAARMKVPVVPAYIEGTDNALPVNAKFIRLKKVSVRFGEPIRIEKMDSYQEAADMIMERIYSLKNKA